MVHKESFHGPGGFLSSVRGLTLGSVHFVVTNNNIFHVVVQRDLKV